MLGTLHRECIAMIQATKKVCGSATRGVSFAVAGAAVLFAAFAPERLNAQTYAPAHFWITDSSFGTTGAPATDAGVTKVTTVSGGTRYLQIWGQPALQNPSAPFSTANPYKTLQNFSLTLTTDGNVVTFPTYVRSDFMLGAALGSITVYNPTVGSTTRYEQVRDSYPHTYQYTYTPPLPDPPVTTTINVDPVIVEAEDPEFFTPYRVRNLQGFNFVSGTQGIGGSSCDNTTYCKPTSTGLAWLIATVKVQVNATQELTSTPIYLQIGERGMSYFGEPTTHTTAVFGAANGPVYSAYSNPEQTFLTSVNGQPVDTPDFIIEAAPTAIPLTWQSGPDGNWDTLDNGGRATGLHNVTVSGGVVSVHGAQQAYHTLVTNGPTGGGRLHLNTGSSLSSDVTVAAGGTITGDGTIGQGLTLGGGKLALTTNQPLSVFGTATLTGGSIGLLSGVTPPVGQEFAALTASGGIIGQFNQTSGLLPGSTNLKIESINYLPLNDPKSVMVKIALMGDFNNDLKVDAGDYATWRKGLGTKYTPADYLEWKSHFGQSVTSGSGAVVGLTIPEPTTAILFLVAGLFCTALFRRGASVKIGASICVFAILSLIDVAPASAVLLYFDGTQGAQGASWINVARWQLNDSASQPAADYPKVNDTAIFNLTNVNPNVVINLDGNQSVRGIELRTSGDVTIQSQAGGAGGNHLSIGSLGIIIGGSSGGHTISNRVDLTAAQTWTQNSGHYLTVDGAINNFGNLLHIAGSGGATQGGGIAINGVLSGAGGVTMDAGTTATLRLAGTNTFTGPFTMHSGTVEYSRDDNLGPNSPTFYGGILRPLSDQTAYTRWMVLGTGGGVTIDAPGINFSPTFSGNLLGDGYLRKTGSGKLILTGTGSDYRGGTVVAQGTLQGNTSTLHGAIGVASGANLTFNQTSAGTYSGAVNGEGNLTVTGGGTLTMTGAAYSGSTTIDNNTKLIWSESVDRVYGNQIFGNGQLIKQGSSKLTLTNQTFHQGGTRVEAGILEGFPLALQRDIFVAGSAGLIFNDATNDSYGGTLSGSGSVTKTGDGTLTLTGINSSFEGPIKIFGGAVSIDRPGRLNDASKNVLEFNNNAILRTNLDPQVGDITLGHAAYINSSGATIETNVSTFMTGQINGPGGLTKTGSATLTLGTGQGVNNFSGPTTIQNGSLRLGGQFALMNSTLNYNGGSFDFGTLNAFTLGGLNGSVALNLVNANSPREGVTLSIGNAPGNPSFSGAINDSGRQTGNGSIIKVGNGTQTLSGPLSYSGSTTVSSGRLVLTNTGNTYGLGTFINGGGTLAVGSDGSLGNATTSHIAINGGTFETTATMSTTRAVTLGNGGGTFNTPASLGTDLTLTNVGNIPGNSGSLIKSGAGKLSLNGANSYTAGTVLNAGTLSFGNSAALGSGPLTINGGNLDSSAGGLSLNNNPQNWASNFTFLGTQSLNLGTGGVSLTTSPTVTVNGNTLTVGGAISGSTRNLSKAGSGTLALTGTNSYNNTFVNAGTLMVGNGGTTGTLGAGNTTVSSGATLSFNLNAPGSYQYSGGIDGNGSVTKSGTGTVILNGSNTYGGGTTISQGTLQIGNGGSTGSVPNSGISNSASLVFNHNNSYSYSGLISGSGSLTQAGGILILVFGGNTYTGDTLIDNSVLNGNNIADYGTPSSFGQGSNSLTSFTFSNGGTLQYTGNTASTNRNISLGTGGGTLEVTNGLTANGIINGTGSLTKTGPGNLTLSNTNLHTGGTFLNTGTLTLNSGAALGATASQFTINGGNVDAATSLTITNNNPQVWANNFAFLGSNNLNLGTGAVTLTANPTLTINASTLTIGGSISGAGRSVTKTGAGKLQLNGNSSYNGGTTLNAGTLSLGHAGALGGGTFTINGGNLDSSVANLSLINYPQTWAGSFTFAGSQNLNLGAGAVSLTSSPTVTVNANTLAVGGVISNSGGTRNLTKAGAGRLVLRGANTFGAAGATSTTITSGILVAENATGSATGPGDVLVNGVLQIGDSTGPTAGASGSVAGKITLSSGYLNFDRTGTITHSGLITGNGQLTKYNTGNLVLTAANDYTGGTTKNESGTLTFGSTSAIGTGPLTINAGSLDSFVPNLVNLRNNTQIWAGNFSFLGTENLDLGTGAVTLNANPTISVAAKALTIGGSIENSTGNRITKDGAGTLVLSGSSNYSGGTTVSGGVVSGNTIANAGSPSAFGQGNFSINNGATLRYTGPTTTMNRSISLSSASGGVFDISSAGTDLTTSGTISGATSFTKTGAGTLTLNTVNSYGDTLVTGGLLSGNSISNHGSPSAFGLGNLSLNNSATLQYSGGNASTNRNLALPGNGALDVKEGSTVLTMNGVISGSASLTKRGTGTLSLIGTNNSIGNAYVETGTLRVESGGRLTAAQHIRSGWLSGSSANSAIVVTGAGSKITAGSGFVVGSDSDGSLTVAASATAETFGINIGNNLAGSYHPNGIATVTGAGSMITASGSLIVGNAANGTLNIDSGGKLIADRESAIANHEGSNGNVTVTGANSTLDINSALTIGNNSSANVSNIATGSLLVSAGGYVENNSGFVAYNAGSQGTATVTGSGSRWSNSDLIIGGGTAEAGGAGSVNVTNNGQLQVANRTNFWKSSSALTVNGATYTTGSLENAVGTSPVIQISNPAGGTAMTVGSDNTSRTFSGSITNAAGGAGSLTKVGAGKLTLSGTNTYTGTTTVSGGRLDVDGSLAGPVVLGSGGTLGGRGTINGKVSGSGRLAPGNSPGILTINGDYEQNTDSVLDVELAGTGGVAGTDFDQVRVSGTAKLAGNLNFIMYNGYVPSELDRFRFLDTFSGGQVDLTVEPNDIFTPGLQALNDADADKTNDLAARVIANAAWVDIEYRRRSTISFDDDSTATAQWLVDANWNTNLKPTSLDGTTVSNQRQFQSANTPQTVEIAIGQTAQAADLLVADPTSPITVAVLAGSKLNVSTGDVMIGNKGAIELNSGLLKLANTQKVELTSGGEFRGVGTVEANLLKVTNGTVKPGITTGTLTVQGAYTQESKGTLQVDVSGTNGAVRDSLAVTGTATLGGKLVVDGTGFTLTTPGAPISILSATLGGTTKFSSVETIDSDEVFFAATYGVPGSGASPGGGTDAGSCTVRVCVGGWYRGDMNRDTIVDKRDIPWFAMALNDPIRYFHSKPDNVHEIGDFGQSAGDLSGPLWLTSGELQYHPDGKLTFDDIPFFARKLGMTVPGLIVAMQQSVPEPSIASLGLITVVLLALAVHRRRTCFCLCRCL